ncbi:MAG TPA: hypothetical protein DEP53_06260 [Bacteroidetes bacterium]|nr:hypothetical protein [Bacteroidota bacterium]
MPDMDIYRHTQIGYVILAVLGIVTAILLILTLTIGLTGLAVGVCAALLLVFFLFGTLTVEVSAEEFSFRFGVGLIRKSFAVSDIKSCVVSSFPWYYGWGLRYTPRGWLYCVSGLAAVTLDLKNGKAIQVGTDDAEGLAGAVTRAIRTITHR